MIRATPRLFAAAIAAAIATLAAVPAWTSAWATESDEARWNELKPALFSDRAIADGSALLRLEAPTRAYDAAIVPITIALAAPQTAERHVTSVSLVIDHNPSPLAAVFHLQPDSGIATIQTRVRIDEYTFVRAIAETNDGKLYMVQQYVKAAGGCSSPSMKDAAVAMQRLGTLKFRQLADLRADGTTEAQLMVSHPNYSGLQMDQLTRHYIPPDYVREIKVALDNRPLLTIDGDIALSEDPTVKFDFAATKPGEVSVTVTDTNDRVFKGSWPISTRAGS
jgi:sulfur-oxidizing protein SoxY